MKSSLPRAMLLDWDNTLVESWGTIHESMNLTLRAMGQSAWSREEIQTKVRASLRDSFPVLFGDRWREAEKVYYDAFSDIHLQHLRPLPGALDLLMAAKDAGLYLGVVSNKRGEFLRREAEHLGWSGYFGALAGAGDAARDKPAPDHARLALGGFAPLGSDIWLVGDTDIDLRCAVASGCLPVLVRERPPENGEFEDCRPALYFENCGLLAAFIRQRKVFTDPTIC